MNKQDMTKIYHQDIDNLSKYNLKIIEKIKSNTDIQLANDLLAQAYLFLNEIDISIPSIKQKACNWCDGCSNIEASGCDSKYCLHANDCVLSEFIRDKLEKSFT